MHESDPAAEIVAAVRAGDVGRAAQLLVDVPDLRRRLDDSLPGLPFDGTLLLAAVGRSDRLMIDLLLENGANINQRSRWWAGGFGVLDSNTELADFLIARGAAVNVHAASRLGRSDTLIELLTRDPSLVHARGGDGQTPLHVAANVETARVLVERGAAIDTRDIDHESTPAQYAIRERQDVARYLLSRGCRTDLLMAAALGESALAERLLDADPAAIRTVVSDRFFPMSNPRAGGTIYFWTLGRNKTAHAVAREFGHEALFQWLLERSPDGLALAVACEVEDEPLVRSLIAARRATTTALSAEERRRIVDAAENNNARVVGLMLAAGWPVDARGNHGATALHFSAWHGDAATVQELLVHRPPLAVRDEDFSSTPMGWALHGSVHGWNAHRGNYPAVVQALLDAGATPPEMSEDLETTDAVREVLRRAAR